MLFLISWRNLWRYPARSFLIMGSVVLGVWAGLFTNAIYFGMGERAGKRSQSGTKYRIFRCTTGSFRTTKRRSFRSRWIRWSRPFGHILK